MPRIEWGIQRALLVSHDYHRIMPCWRQGSGLPLWALMSLSPVVVPLQGPWGYPRER